MPTCLAIILKSINFAPPLNSVKARKQGRAKVMGKKFKIIVKIR